MYNPIDWRNPTNLSLRILPVLTMLFLCSFLDRTNVGNAKTYNLEKDLNMSDFQYETGLAVYYATYIGMWVLYHNIISPSSK